MAKSWKMENETDQKYGRNYQMLCKSSFKAQAQGRETMINGNLIANILNLEEYWNEIKSITT